MRQTILGRLITVFLFPELYSDASCLRNEGETEVDGRGEGRVEVDGPHGCG